MFGFGKKTIKFQEAVINNLQILVRESIGATDAISVSNNLLREQNSLLIEQLALAQRLDKMQTLAFKEEMGASAPRNDEEEAEYQEMLIEQEKAEKAFSEMYFDDISISRNGEE